MARTEVYFEVPPIRDDYTLALVDGDYLLKQVRPKQFLHIDQSECILCEGCVDICPWKCIHYLSIGAIRDTSGVADPHDDPEALGFFLVDEDTCTRCALCIDRCPTGVITLGKFEGSLAAAAAPDGLPAPWEIDSGERDHKNGFVYGIRGM